jgi:imidazolonepropionase
MMFKTLTHASELLTGAGIRKKEGKRIEECDLGRIADGAMVIQINPYKEKIIWVGPTKNLPKRYLKTAKINLKNKRAIIPGLVDCHTHLVFAGNRAQEFADRCAGKTYEAIAKQGGGILSTVQATRAASYKDLEKLAIPRIKESYAFGVRTLEIKSGYGLSFESEIKILKVIQTLKKRFPEMTIQATFLGAHAFPPEQLRQEYLNEILNVMLPEVSKKKLAEACDVFIDKDYFTREEGQAILERSKSLGLKTKIHADELFNTESAALASEMHALSADHLLKISDNGIKKISESNTVAVLLPGTAFYLKTAQAPARKLLDSGATVALATDFNPGTCMSLSLPAIMTLAALYLGMSRAEIFGAVTYNGVKALGLHLNKGTLECGMDADYTILPFSKFEEIYYRFAWSPLTTQA